MQLPENIATIIIFTSFFTQTHLNYHSKGTTSDRSAELYGDGNERQLCVGDCFFNSGVFSFSNLALGTIKRPIRNTLEDCK